MRKGRIQLYDREGALVIREADKLTLLLDVLDKDPMLWYGPKLDSLLAFYSPSSWTIFSAEEVIISSADGRALWRAFV